MAKTKSQDWHILREVLLMDHTKPNSWGGMHYEYVELFNGTESKAEKHCEKLEEKDPVNVERSEAKLRNDVDWLTAHHPYNHHTYICLSNTPGWYDYITRSGLFELRGFVVQDAPKTEPDYESMTKEELIALLKAKK